MELRIGEYFLHAFVEETVSLYSEGGDSLNPKILVKSMGRQQASHPKKDIQFATNCFWGDHFYFSKKYTERQEAEDERVEIMVVDHSKVLRDALIGSVSISLSAIYSEPEHTIRNRWYILQHKGKDYQKVMGYIKLSFNLAEISDTRQILLPEETTRQGDLGRLPIPPEIKMERKELRIALFQGRSIAPLDRSLTGKPSCDPYVQVNFGEQILRSKVVKNSLNPDFSQFMYIPLAEPVFVTQVEMQVKDQDLLSDDAIGSIRLKISDIRAGVYSKPSWINIYGAPLGATQKDERIQMNTFPQAASAFKGSLLMLMEIWPAENPRYQIDDIPNDAKTALLANQTPSQFAVVVDLASVFALGGDRNSQYSVEATAGEFGGNTGRIDLVNGTMSIYKRIAFGIELSHGGEASMPDVFVRVLKDGKPWVYYRVTVKTLLFVSTNSYSVYSLQIDRSCVSMDQLGDHEAGYIRLRARVFRGSIPQDYLPPVVPRATPVLILANLIRAVDLPSGDDSGLADPYAQMDHHGSRSISGVCRNTLDPVWNQRIGVEGYILDDTLPPLVLSMYDADDDDPRAKFEFLGKALVDLPKDVLTADKVNSIPKPQWIDLETSATLKMGRVLISFQIFPLTPDPRASMLALAFDLQPYRLKLRLLGLRNLQSRGLFPIKKPYIRLNLSGLRTLSSSGTTLDMLTANSKKGNSSANISEIVK